MKFIENEDDPHIVVIVCGGNMVSIDYLQEWKQQFNL